MLSRAKPAVGGTPPPGDKRRKKGKEVPQLEELLAQRDFTGAIALLEVTVSERYRRCQADACRAAGRGEPFPCLASPSPPPAPFGPCRGSCGPSLRRARFGLRGLPAAALRNVKAAAPK
ncbi:hypothetical protein BTVI_01246 [Pitangus sulphuratus]|nr:hypothetical protein BTVI_01246 [Pitangus sulphuratus]